MKKLLLLLFFIPLISIGQVGINNENPDPSSALDVTSTIGGLLIPRMTENQRNEIIAPATGLMVYQTDNTTGFYYYNGSSWTTFYSKNEVDTLIANIQNQIEEQNQNIDNDFDGFSENSGDCDDSDSSIYPGAIEVCGDGIDQDCDGSDTLCNTPPVINSVTIIPNTGITKQDIPHVPPMLPSIRIAANSSLFKSLVSSIICLLSGRDVVAIACLFLFQFANYPEIQTYQDFGVWFFYLTIISTRYVKYSSILF